ncbi:WLM domain-containing protein [Lentinula lateritia]|uniref:WLM domain-containing protein n=1 Tax=Lentinula aff. lateritia TaxID=2804960 RepID=A0ACC1UDP7_9AGAR|nr:WLM domain-containing protein [Lentinula aff. lateritia]KAJ3856122.1 WLM domain-containing protein [Lentinula lateritia]
MVHSRFNEKETSPNPHINFITSLPAEDSEDARQLLRALAAQVRPIMKAHGLTVNSLEEYEFNAVFAGRNWESGETIELVLRRPGGSFLPSSWLMSTLCHELAHNKHMNHGPAFHALWQELRNEVRQLQNKGYYGDGYWSAGTRLADSAVVSGQGLGVGDLPQYICGGAQNRTRPSNLRQRRGPRPRKIMASSKTGRQTAKKRKAGSRVTSKYAFQGEGTSLSAGEANKGFRKQASSKRAREERAFAAQKRLQSASASSSSATHLTSPTASTPYASDEEFLEDAEIITETDADRKQTLLATEKDEDLKNLHSGTSWKDFENDFIFTGRGQTNVVVISSDEEKPSSKIPKNADSKSGLRLGNSVKTEVAFRKKKALGMTPVQREGRTIGGSESGNQKQNSANSSWPCLVCTLQPLHLACAACGTEKGHNLPNS